VTRDTSTLVQTSSGAAVRAIKTFSLSVVAGPSGSASFGPFTRASVGSARSNDLVLADPTVSRFHFTIERTQDGLRLVDSGSTNGTFILERRVRDLWVADGDRIRAGESEIVVRVDAAPTLVEVERRDRFGDLIGESAAMQDLFGMLERLARADAPVLVQGETGTGKELIARALHFEGRRKTAPFVVVDCGAVAPTLVESELFGHEKGAFTGADMERIGAFEAAHAGTVFLDEIGELPAALQPKLLRVLESQTLKRVGSNLEKKVDVRVIAATHRDLRRMVNEGQFREDLYFRLAVCPVTVPPLRDRTSDIPVLARHFLARTLEAASFEGPVPRLSPDSIGVLMRRDWPGNIRELRNVVERAVILASEVNLRSGDLAELFRTRTESGGQVLAGAPLEELKRRFEREYLVKLIARYPKDRARAAEEAGVHTKSLQRLLRKHGLLDKGAAADDDDDDAEP
jgi:DNA-binding NtrC family response regulator